MKSKKLLAAVLTVTMVASMSLMGCGENKRKMKIKMATLLNKKTKDEKKEDEKIDKDQYLNVFLAEEPKTIDQSKSTDLYSSDILTNVSEALGRSVVKDDGIEVVEEAGAEKWEVSEDGLTWTFKIRDMKWQDGKKVTANDYEYGMKRTIDKKTGSQYAFLLYPIKNAQACNSGKAKVEDVGIKAKDESTLEITLENKCPYFQKLLAFKVFQPQRQDFVEQQGDKYGSDADKFLCCGPFLLKEWSHNNKVELEKNPDYWNADNIKLQKVSMKLIKEEPARMAEMINGNIDMGGAAKKEWVDKIEATGEFENKKAYAGNVGYTFFNTKNKYFKNAKIRKAFILALNREEAMKPIYRGVAEPAFAWCPPGVLCGDQEYRKLVDNNPIKKLQDENPDPKALLQEGLKEEGLDPDPSKHTLTFLQGSTSAFGKELSEYFQQVYNKALGVNIKIEYCEWAVYQTRTQNMQYDLASQMWGGDYNDPSTFFDIFVSTSGMIPNGWKSEKYDKLIEEANKITDDSKKRAEKFKEAEDLLIYEEGVVSPDGWQKKNSYVRKYVKGHDLRMFGASDFSPMYTVGREK